MAQPTIKDVAKLAGVSISTVSRVMNKSKPVSPEAERKVIDAINKLGFKPNELARSLVMKKSNSIGILVKDIGISYMAEMIRGAEEIGRMYNYDILLSSTYGESELEKKAIDFLYRKQVEGVIIISENIDPETFVRIKEYHLPYVLLDRFYQSSDFHTITVDYRQAMKDMVNFLIQLGNQKILYVKSDLSYDLCRQKALGYEEAIREANYVPLKIEVNGYNVDNGYESAEHIIAQMKSGERNAVLCENDELALGLLTYCYDHGYSIPEEFQLAGFGGSPFAQVIRPRLTTWKEPYYDIGAVAMRCLTKELQEQKKLTETLYLPMQILEGETTKQRD